MKRTKPISTKAKILIIIGAILLAIFLIVLAVNFLVFKTYHAEDIAFEALSFDDGIIISRFSKMTVFTPNYPKSGLVFMTGARVECEAYAPLMKAFAQQGILCVLIDSPFNFPFFDTETPKDIPSYFPEIETWFIGGHSLGGVVSSYILEESTDCYDGILLIASFPSKDFSKSDIKLISIYGENDGVLSMSSYKASKKYWPEDSYEIIIPGGNHTGYAYYPDQPSDKTATITKEEQIRYTAEHCAALMIDE